MKKELAVKKTVMVNAPQAHVFMVFTENQSAWWPLETHHLGAQTPQSVIIEPRAGGRWFERAVDGTECDWGKVLVWDPFGRLVLSWEISAQFTRDPNLKTEVEVLFITEGSERTRVELEHRLLENYGEEAEMMRSIFDSDGGWTGIMARFATQAAGGTLSSEEPCPADQPK